ncbi:MAG: hypothetical protein ACKO17_03495, partial [Bacteroidota bacterium]
MDAPLTPSCEKPIPLDPAKISSAGEMLDAHLQEKIERKKEAGLYRTLISPEGRIDFSSNDYFGLSKHEALCNLAHPDLPAGATGSRSISGNSTLAEETESAI